MECFDMSFKWLGLFLPASAILSEMHFHTVIPHGGADQTGPWHRRTLTHKNTCSCNSVHVYTWTFYLEIRAICKGLYQPFSLQSCHFMPPMKQVITKIACTTVSTNPACCISLIYSFSCYSELSAERNAW